VSKRGITRKQIAVRELYCPAHFGNSYEVALPLEMTEILKEALFWGFNRYSDWFDTIDLYDVYRKHQGWYNMPEAIWERKFSHFACASRLGFECGLAVTPNHVFSNQVTPDNEATKGKGIFGQLVCPSKPGVVEMVLENYGNLFNDFKQRDIRISSISAYAYDYGGCACEACQPWVVTFGRLFEQIAGLAGDTFGKLEVNPVCWGWSNEDYGTFAQWADKEAKGRFDNIVFGIPSGASDYALQPIPRGARERAFVNIAYGEYSSYDAYGHYGPPIAPSRIEKTVRYLFSRQAQGFMAYSEGICDEINQALLAGLTSGQFGTSDKILTAYAERHLGGSVDGWCRWLRMMGDPFTADAIDIKKARPLFDRLKVEAKKGWRLQQLEERLIMAESNATVRARSNWDAERLKAAEAFWASKERLYRNVWRLGLPRHIFRFHSREPEWYQEYVNQKNALPGEIINEFDQFDEL